MELGRAPRTRRLHGDAPASYLRIEEREVEAGGLN
jgi:hypothetical protein